MGKFMKSGKVVLVLGGRYAGRKAVIVKVRYGLGYKVTPQEQSSPAVGNRLITLVPLDRAFVLMF